MENAIANMPHNEVQAENRNIDVVTAEIKTICMQAKALALTYAIEVGRRLEEAKAMLPHGEWGTWLKERTEFSQSTANNLMRLYHEYGNEQIGFFGSEMNSQTLGKLTYTKALKLLALPEDEREAFVEDNDVENMSTRELEKAIRERDEALQKAEKADEVEQAYKIATDKLTQMEIALKNSKTQAETAQAEMDRLTKQVEKAKELEKKAKDRYELLKKNPQLSDEDMAKIKAEADAQAAESFKKQLEDKLAEVNKKLREAERAKEDADWEKQKAQAELKELKNKTAMSDPAVAKFKALFDQSQHCLIDLVQSLNEIADNETHTKLTQAVNSLCKQFIKE